MLDGRAHGWDVYANHALLCCLPCSVRSIVAVSISMTRYINHLRQLFARIVSTPLQCWHTHDENIACYAEFFFFALNGIPVSDPIRQAIPLLRRLWIIINAAREHQMVTSYTQLFWAPNFPWVSIF